MVFTKSQENHWRKIVEDNFDNTLERVYIPELDYGKGSFHSGKVRDNYVINYEITDQLPNDELITDERLIITTDRISVFDYIVGTIPFKGQLLNQMALYFLEHTKDIVSSAFVNQAIDPIAMLQEQTTSIKLEAIVRAYLTGSAWRSFESGNFLKSGIDMRQYLKFEKKNEEFIELLFTPTEKSDTDPDISREIAIEKGIISAEQFDKIKSMAFKLFKFGQDYFYKKGLLLVDSKFEFGINGKGEINLIDELLTPDSSRFWDSTDYQLAYKEGREPKQLSKEFLRDILIKAGYETKTHQKPNVTKDMLVETAVKYIELYELFTGGEFEPNFENPKKRLLKNLVDADIINGQPSVVIIADQYNDYKDMLVKELRKANIGYKEIFYEFNGTKNNGNKYKDATANLEKELYNYCFSITPVGVILLDMNGLQLSNNINSKLNFYTMNSVEVITRGLDINQLKNKLFP